MKKVAVLLASVVWGLLSVAGAAADPAFGWSLNHAEDGGGAYRLEALSPERYVLTGTRTEVSCKVARAIVARTVGREMWTQNVVMFSVRSTTGRLIRIIPEIHWKSGGRSQVARSEKLIFQDALWHNVTLTLGADFGLPDASVELESIALEIDIENWNPGQTGGIEVRNMKSCGPGEVAFAGAAEETFEIVPGDRRSPKVPRPDALKVFFALDNEDVVPTLMTGKKFSRQNPLVFDAQQCGGFREELLRDLDGQATVTTDLASADVIVYSRCRPDPDLAQRLVACVTEKGVPLYAAAEIADPEIAAILPCELGPDDSAHFPPRYRLTAKDGLPEAEGLTDATFGIYRPCTARPGADVLLSFVNGVPAVLEGTSGKGRVLYTMTGLGQTLVPRKRSYDAFFVRLLSRLSGRKLPEASADLYAPDADGWYAGIGTDDCGRFGWEYASGLLVEDLGGSLRVVKGNGEYAFRPCRASGKTVRSHFTFAPTNVTALSESGRICVDGEPFADFSGSLAYPGTRWDLLQDRARLELFGLATHVAIPCDGTVRICAANEKLPPPKDWSAPWMLLFTDGPDCVPMLVTFGRKLDALEAIVEDGVVAGFELGRDQGSVGPVIVTWPWGNAPVAAAGWVKEGLPAEAAARVALWYPRSFAYPVRLDEKFRRTPDGRRFEVVDRYSYLETADDWGTAHRPYAPLPPYAFYMKDAFGGRYFQTSEPAVVRLATRTGPYADVPGDTVRWTMPVPEPDLGLLPHTVGYPAYEAIANLTFREGVRYSCGGRTPFEAINKAYPGRKSLPEIYNWNMHQSLLGVCRMMPNPYGLDATNRTSYARRIVTRLLEPLETHAYKMTTRWRVDPMSGARYTIYMNSPRAPQATYSEAGFGSKFLYGDSNETIRMIAAALQMTADRHGQYGAAKANWETLFRHVASYGLKLDDWLNLSAGCIERGSSYSIDMLNTEYGGMCSFARLAEICGDTSAREQFLFRAARRAIPTLARLTVSDWQKRAGVLPDDGEYVDFACGCGEAGPRPAARHPKAIRDLLLYDMSQGICSDLLALYRASATDELRRRYFPQVRTATTTNGLDWVICAILALGDDLPKAELQARLDQVSADEARTARLCRDWPGVQTASYQEYALAYLADTPRISDCRDVDLHDATYDPASAELTLDFTPGTTARLEVTSDSGSRRPVDVARPGVRRTVKLRFSRPAGVNGVRPKTGAERPLSPLDPGLREIGRLRARDASEVGRSNWTIGCEVLDRDFANYWEYCDLIAPLGIKTVRLQAGWAKCEPQPGAFNFGWLDRIIDDLRARDLEVILETSYGNPIYPGAGGWDLSGGIPTSEEGLAAWDRWVDVLSRHFADRVAYWAMWNEPDNNREVNTPARVAAFNLRTARIIRRNCPTAKLQGLSLGGNDPEYFEDCLRELAKENAVDLFDTYIYHGYELAPERSYPMVEVKRRILAKYAKTARLRQGENGAPSEMIDFFALWNNPWTEYTQAKWDLRRMLGDLGHGYESAVYTMSDFRHRGEKIRSPNNKGLVRANANRETIGIKRAYYAVQNVAGLFDAGVVRDLSGAVTNTDITIAWTPYRKTAADGRVHPLIAFWQQGHMSAKEDWTQVKPADLVLDRPSDAFATRPTVFETKGAAFEDPVWVDLLTGRVYEFPKDRMLVHSAGVTFVDVPVYDSPVVLTERAALSLDGVR